MSRNPKLITHYGYMSDTELATMATRTLEALRTNTNFPDLDPAFVDYEPVAQTYIARQAITADGRASGQQKEEKDEARAELLVYMRRMASYVNNFTGVSSIQLSSGFLPVSQPKPSQSPRSSVWARILDSARPAEILLQFEAVREAYQYEMQLARELDESGQPRWFDLPPAPRAQGNFYAPVVDNVIYYFRVRSRNKKGVSEWTTADPLRARVK